MAKLELYHPVKPWDGGQPFGEKDPAYTAMGLLGHNGIDEPCPVGTPVRAAHNGTVIVTAYNPTAGFFVVILDESGMYKTCYLHNSKLLCQTGQKVVIGDKISLSGNTGFSTGPHVHFMLYEVRDGKVINEDNGYKGAINPKPFFNGFYAEDAQNVQGILQKAVDMLVTFLVNAKK
jgi:murein DD-endopeptidase MepM/ murein hydrolase activator NlpD